MSIVKLKLGCDIHLLQAKPPNLYDTLRLKYLESIPSLLLQHPPEARIKRAPFAAHYGGSSQHFLQYTTSNRNPSGNYKRNMVFPQPDPNPVLPVLPGEPGLIFASRHELANQAAWSLFVKHDPGVAVWTYLGEYKGEVCGKLTPDQFKALSDKVINQVICY